MEESGSAFELRGLSLARAIHDPLGTQGAEMHLGKERDAVFVNESQIHVYEFTVERTKAKAEKDGGKLVETMRKLAAQPANAYRSVTGWFVTRDEPTADQRSAILHLARKYAIPLHAISISTLKQRICNSELYLQHRDESPFGSIAYAPAASGADFRVDVRFNSLSSAPLSVANIADALVNGERFVLTGDFGVGKSHGLRELYRALRKEHLRSKKLTPFPLHINLRDCVGLRTPAEILRRHAEEIGFTDERSLISVWRSGGIVLMLDGFDEIVPVRWLGNAADLRTLRWEAMAPIRRFVQETPERAGVIVCGRPNYFSSSTEMAEALGLGSKAQALGLADFTDSQVRDYLRQAQVEWEVPDWIPTRPLLLGYLAAMREAGSGGDYESDSRSRAWRQLLKAICQRESRMFAAVRPETIESIICRVATLARSTGNETGPIGMDELKAAFVAVNARQPDEEGLQVLLRLPGLTVYPSGPGAEQRMFVDTDLAETAYGVDLAAYIVDPHAEHPLRGVASWVAAVSELGVAVAADAIEEQGVQGNAVLAVASSRDSGGQFDSILADVLRVASSVGVDSDRTRHSFLVEGVIFDELEVTGDDNLMAKVRFVDCIFQRVDLTGAEQGGAYPQFARGMIGLVDGVATMPDWLSESFDGVEIEGYSHRSQTTSGIMQLALSTEDKIALSVLKKVYGQRGAGRKEGALSRGLDLSLRPLVPAVLGEMVSAGWIQRSSAGNTTLYVPIKERRASALQALNAPGDFRLRR